MKGIEIDAYSKGFHDGMSLDKKYPTTVTIMGYNFDKVLKLIQHDMEKKMTRKEAISKCHGVAYPEALIQALEAIGLIKFEEPEVVIHFEQTTPYHGTIRLQTTAKNGLELWVGGRLKYEWSKDNQK